MKDANSKCRVYFNLKVTILESIERQLAIRPFSQEEDIIHGADCRQLYASQIDLVVCNLTSLANWSLLIITIAAWLGENLIYYLFWITFACHKWMPWANTVELVPLLVVRTTFDRGTQFPTTTFLEL